MPWGEFVEVRLLPGDAGLEVRGTYDPKVSSGHKMVGDAFIGFLIIQDESGNPTRIVDGVAGWTYADPDVNGKYHQWVATVDGAKVKAAGITLGKVRAIGNAVQVTVYSASLHDPPGVEYFTWCVEQNVV